MANAATQKIIDGMEELLRREKMKEKRQRLALESTQAGIQALETQIAEMKK